MFYCYNSCLNPLINRVIFITYIYIHHFIMNGNTVNTNK